MGSTQEQNTLMHKFSKWTWWGWDLLELLVVLAPKVTISRCSSCDGRCVREGTACLSRSQVMPGIVLHCRSWIFLHLRLQEKGRAHESLTSLLFLQGQWSWDQPFLMEKVKFQLAQVCLLFSNFASSSTKSCSLGLEQLWDISSGSTKEETIPALKCSPAYWVRNPGSGSASWWVKSICIG